MYRGKNSYKHNNCPHKRQRQRRPGEGSEGEKIVYGMRFLERKDAKRFKSKGLGINEFVIASSIFPPHKRICVTT